MKKNNTAEERMNEFAKFFENKLFPTIRGADGKGIERLRKIVEEKRKELAKRTERKQHNEED